MRRLRLRELRPLARGCTARKWQSQGLSCKAMRLSAGYLEGPSAGHQEYRVEKSIWNQPGSLQVHCTAPVSVYTVLGNRGILGVKACGRRASCRPHMAAQWRRWGRRVLCVRVRLRGRCWGAFCFSPSVWSLGPRGHVLCAPCRGSFSCDSNPLVQMRLREVPSSAAGPTATERQRWDGPKPVMARFAPRPLCGTVCLDSDSQPSGAWAGAPGRWVVLASRLPSLTWSAPQVQRLHQGLPQWAAGCGRLPEDLQAILPIWRPHQVRHVRFQRL